MELAKKIYLYSKYYQNEMVTSVLAIENFHGKDWDKRYSDYIDYFDTATKAADSKLLTEEGFISLLKKNRNSFIATTYKRLFDDFIKKLKNDENILQNKIDDNVIQQRLAKFKTKERFNIDYLLEIRKIYKKMLK